MARRSYSIFATTASVLSLLALVGCAADDADTGASDTETTGQAELMLTTVPATGVACIALSATIGATTTTKYLTVTANSSSTGLIVGQLPTGTATINAKAYALACTDSTVTAGTAQANWVADPVTALLDAGVATKLSLTFRKVETTTLSANFVSSVNAVYAAGYTTYVVLSDGSVRYAGYVSTGQAITTLTPLGLTGVRKIAGSTNFACAVRDDGTVWCWGQNAFGQLGNGTTTTSSTPVQVSGLTGMTDVVAGGSHVCAGAAQGGVYCWGSNSNGQLGNSSTTNALTPVYVGNYSGAGFAASSASTYVINNAASVYSSGYNAYGQLGAGTTTDRLSFGATNISRDTVQVSAGYGHACGLLRNGTVNCWGFNANGQLGNGTTTNASSPVVVTGLSNVVAVSAGYSHACALTSAGSVYCWGYNGDGAIGLNTFSNSVLTPTLVAGLPAIAQISAGTSYTCALTTDRVAYCWGYNSSGQLATGDYLSQPAPVLLKQ